MSGVSVGITVLLFMALGIVFLYAALVAASNDDDNNKRG